MKNRLSTLHAVLETLRRRYNAVSIHMVFTANSSGKLTGRRASTGFQYALVHQLVHQAVLGKNYDESCRRFSE